MVRTSAWKSANQVDPSAEQRKNEAEFKGRNYLPNQPMAKFKTAATVSKRKRPDRARELEMIDEFLEARGSAA